MPRFKFDFAISYAGENERVAESLAGLLAKYGAGVYYARHFQTRLLGRRMSGEFGAVFGPGTRFFVPIVSEHYARKEYPQYEWEIAVRESKKRKKEFILPLRLDDTPLVGLPMDVGFLNLKEINVDEAARRLIAKLPTSRQLWPQHWVATFGLIIEELLQQELLPESAPKQYVPLCDWLTEDLLERLQAQGLRDLQFLQDDRDGETLSVRVGFTWTTREKPIAVECVPWWDILEIIPYKEAYG